MRRLDDTSASAIHEAGHLLVCAQLGIPFEMASLGRIGETAGRVRIANPERVPPDAWLIFLAAGYAAVLLVSGDKDHAGETAMGDLRAVVQEIGRDRAAERFAWAANRAYDLLRTYESDLIRVAATLARRHVICAADVREILDRSRLLNHG